MNLYPTFEQGLKAELPLFRHLTLLSIEVSPHRFGQLISVHYLEPTGLALSPTYIETRAEFWIAGTQLTPRSAERVRRAMGLSRITVSGAPPKWSPRKQENIGFAFQVST
ncbi:hypothetical protein [Deinococcus cellulosilyticus]|uniref:Uncharacterized protein n=1 Tax=Deinococcus cellulosilyticus (strain DSM 18568 / NBRC 106333 / KACC 11606 / 5516J-15) TaxID=1223518 RepID=A0A511N655_DEIC1|nr:hypothetical protein [Deinococcus cellulosilyticus]GEM48324.1 hypothetical protein DC3_39590 [Deinococcus cellulosilyticus NBRC 106333 = KACC 11606]